MNEDTPQKTNCINITIQNTPLPQACSTVHRTSVHSKKLNMSSNMKVDKALDLSGISTTSSLGILNLDDVNLDLLNFNNEQPLLSAAAHPTDKLTTQRNLALKALEMADKEPQESTVKVPNMGISYLLRPSESNGDQSSYAPKHGNTLNNSCIPEISNTLNGEISNQLDSSANLDMSQSVQEILAASCLKDVQDTFNDFSINDTGSIDIWNPDNGVFGTMRSSSFSGEQYVDSIDLSFTPSEEVPDRLMANELSWRRNCADLPLDLPTPSPNPGPEKESKQNFSCFSEYIPDQDSSLRNTASMSTFFKGRSGNLKQFLSSESSTSNRLMMVDLTADDTNDITDTIDDQFNIQPAENKVPNNQTLTNSVLSISAIEKIIYQEDNNTPTRLMDLLLKNNKCQYEVPRNESIVAGNIKVKDGKLSGELSNDSINNIESITILSSTMNSQNLDLVPNKENKDPYIQDNRQTVKDVKTKKITEDKRLSLPVLSDKSNFITPVPLINVSDKIKNNWDSGVPNDSSSSEYHYDDSLTSAAGEIYKTANKGSYFTISQIDTQLCPLGCSIEVPLILTSKSQQKLLIKILLKEITTLDAKKIIDAGKLLNIDAIHSVYLQPLKQNKINIFVSGLAICSVKVSLEFHVIDNTTHDIASMYSYDFFIQVCHPYISVKSPGGDILDFSEVPEKGSKVMIVDIINDGPMNLEISTSFKPFSYPEFFVVDSITPIECTTEKTTHTHSFIVPSKGNAYCKIRFNAPEIPEKCDLKKITYGSTFNVSLTSALNNSTIKCLKTTGTVVKSQIMFDAQKFPIQLRFGETREIEIANFGYMSLSYRIFIALSRENPQECEENIFKLDRTSVTIEPGETAVVNVTFVKNIPEQREVAFQEIHNRPIEFWQVIGLRKNEQLPSFNMVNNTPEKYREPNHSQHSRILSPVSPNMLDNMTNSRVLVNVKSPNCIEKCHSTINQKSMDQILSLNENIPSFNNMHSPDNYLEAPPTKDKTGLSEHGNLFAKIISPDLQSRYSKNIISPTGTDCVSVAAASRTSSRSPVRNYLLPSNNSEGESISSISPKLKRSQSPRNVNFLVPSTNSSYAYRSASGSTSGTSNTTSFSPRPETKMTKISSSGSNLNKLPIRATHDALSWPSIKKGKQKCQEVLFKNLSPKKLKLTIGIVGDGFSIIKDRETTKVINTVLQSSEVRTLTILFEATSVGVSFGKITFSSVQGYSNRTIFLSAFGGHAEVVVNGVFKHPNGTQFLSLGELKIHSLLSKTFQLHNKGTVSAFAVISVENIGKISLKSPEINVHPKEVVIAPGANEAITVSIASKKEWVNKLTSEVVSIGSLSILTGDEGLRHRIRKLYLGDKDRETDKIWRRIKPLCKTFNDEPTFQNISRLQESKGALDEIFSATQVLEVGLTIERTTNKEASNLTLMVPDESLMLKTLISD